MKTCIALSCLGLVSLVLAGCADPASTTSTVAAAEPVNAVCPVMKGKIDGETSVDWNGKKVGFCCPPCIDEWNKMSDEDRQKALDEAAKGGDAHGEHGDHGDHADHDDSHEGDESETAEESTEDEPIEADTTE